MTTNNWNIDTAHSGINFSVRHMVVSKVRGRFGKFSGELAIDDGDLTRSSVDVAIDAASIDTGNAQRDTHLRSADFFDVETFPELRFRSTRIEKRGDARYAVVGELTIRDVTREVVARRRVRRPRARTRGATSASASSRRRAIDRKDFGLALESGAGNGRRARRRSHRHRARAPGRPRRRQAGGVKLPELREPSRFRRRSPATP